MNTLRVPRRLNSKLSRHNQSLSRRRLRLADIVARLEKRRAPIQRFAIADLAELNIERLATSECRAGGAEQLPLDTRVQTACAQREGRGAVLAGAGARGDGVAGHAVGGRCFDVDSGVVDCVAAVAAGDAEVGDLPGEALAGEDGGGGACDGEGGGQCFGGKGEHGCGFGGGVVESGRGWLRACLESWGLELLG